ncbi:MAG TPA: nucleoside recognition domain-containing protein [Candidatus Polarisedimenticolaceae bacterium]|nr:nucleoside recognition domain-containing protein [Candidatus Polarisedimenticolaceae bacterium]
MLNGLFVVLVLASVLVAALTGRLDAVSSGALDAARKAVDLAIGLVGAMSLFMGLMRVAQDGGLLRLIARAAAPVMRRLFPQVPQDHPAMSAMTLCIASNLLGLGNAATPFGIRAMQELDRLNPVKGTATDAMVMFLAINTAGLAIVPSSVIGLRAAAGSADPGGIVFATWFASGCATIAAIAAATLLARLPRFRTVPPPASTEDRAAAGALEAESSPSPRAPRLGGILAAGYALALLVALALSLARRDGSATAGAIAREVFSSWTVPGLIAGFVLFGWARGVPVYESLIEGAKDGFQVALRIMPYLIAILVAVGMFRESGCLPALVTVLSPVTAPIGLPAEAVPVALLRPLSGSGSFGVMSEILDAHGPDSYLGYLVSTMQGATDTTFYILAVYFGAVGIRKTRHAIPAGLATDAAGILAAVLICRLVWGGLTSGR